MLILAMLFMVYPMLRAFLIGTTIRPGSSYSSVDHSIYENAHGFWDKLSAAENTEYLNNKGTVTPSNCISWKL